MVTISVVLMYGLTNTIMSTMHLDEFKNSLDYRFYIKTLSRSLYVRLLLNDNATCKIHNYVFISYF